jgi:hypothetical protein
MDSFSRKRQSAAAEKLMSNPAVFISPGVGHSFGG